MNHTNLINWSVFCRMEHTNTRLSEWQSIKRGRGRPKKIVKEDQTSGASSSDPLDGDVGMEIV